MRIANALDANPLEFFIAEGLIQPGHIASYHVPLSNLLVPLAKKLDRIDPKQRPQVVTMLMAVLETIANQAN